MSQKIKVLHVVDWDRTFENFRTREIVGGLKWVTMPTRQDSAGFCELMNHEHGTAHYGCWTLLCEIAAKCKPRGYLIRTAGKGSPGNVDATSMHLHGGVSELTFYAHNATTLARQAHADEKVFSAAIPRLIDVGWLELVEVEIVAGEVVAAASMPSRANASTRKTNVDDFPMQSRAVQAQDRHRHRSTEAGEVARKRAPVSFAKPEWAEVQAFAVQIELAEWKALDWFREMESIGWLDYRSRPVIAWRPIVERIRTKWIADGKPVSPPARPTNGAVKPMSVLDLKTVIGVKEKKAVLLRAKHFNEGNLGGRWDSPQAFEQFRSLKADIRRLEGEIERRAP